MLPFDFAATDARILLRIWLLARPRDQRRVGGTFRERVDLPENAKVRKPATLIPAREGALCHDHS
jgi:hypothetical protein